MHLQQQRPHLVSHLSSYATSLASAAQGTDQSACPAGTMYTSPATAPEGAGVAIPSGTSMFKYGAAQHTAEEQKPELKVDEQYKQFTHCFRIRNVCIQTQHR